MGEQPHDGNPYDPPSSDAPDQPANRLSHDPSIEHEPHLLGDASHLDPTELAAEHTIHRAAAAQSEEDKLEHSIWDEPGLAHHLAGRAEAEQLGYAGWLRKRLARTTAARSWAVTCAVAAAAGPWAILGALMGGWQGVGGIIMLTVVGPLTEEIMKIALALWIVEKRPYLFRTAAQIAICALAGGLIFAAVENVMYLNYLIPNPSAGIVQWRWTVCTALHAGCSLVAGFGLIRIWRHTMANKTRPQLALGSPLFCTAIVLHGLYNGLAKLLHLTGHSF